MATPVEISIRAEADLEQIVDQISVDRPMAARRQLERLLARIGQLGAFPDSGLRVAALGPNVRTLSAPPYLIFYARLEDRVVILRVSHAARNRP